MIKARKLFLVPALGALLLLIPLFGIPIYLLLVASWYQKNRSDIHLYFRGQNYRQNEVSEDQVFLGL